MNSNRLSLCHSSLKPKTLLVWRIARFLIFPQWVSKMVSLDSPPPLHPLSFCSTPQESTRYWRRRRNQSIWVQDSQKRKHSVTKDNFLSLLAGRGKRLAQSCFQDLVGNKPLSQLSKKVSTTLFSVNHFVIATNFSFLSRKISHTRLYLLSYYVCTYMKCPDLRCPGHEVSCSDVSCSEVS